MRTAEDLATAASSRFAIDLAARAEREGREPSVDHAFALGRILSELEARDIAREYRVASPLPTGIIEWVSL